MQNARTVKAGRGALLSVLAAVFLIFGIGQGFADETAKAAREILNKYQQTVITVQLTIEQQMGSFGTQKTESQTEAIGTIIDPSGLTVLSLFSTDPLGRIISLVRGSVLSEQDMSMLNVESQVKDVKMIMPDGKEVPAQIVLRDTDLDLAFVRPIEKLTTPVAAVDLSKAAKPEVLDQMVVLSRLGKVASRFPLVSLCRIQSIVTKPRTFFVPNSDAMEGGFGAPAFSLDGKVAGVLVLRALISRDIGGVINSLFSGTRGMGILPVILPAEDIAEVAKQAPEAKKEKTVEEREEKKEKEETVKKETTE
jgi:hypothetical protein